MIDLSTLNEGQRAAVSAPDGAFLVVAGAGTGKTRTLTHRVAWLIEQGVAPWEIVLLTFTRRAANEMLERAQSLVGQRAQYVRGGTFHSFANQLLRRHGGPVGLSPDFSIIDRGDAESLVNWVRAEMGLGGRDRGFPTKKVLLNVISKSINTSRSIADVLVDEFPQYEHEAQQVEEVARVYQERKRAQQVVDFDDLLVLLAELLSKHPAARQEIAAKCRHVLVDEYQDTNKLQAKIAALLASTHGNLMVVGDEAQSIYGFRGARVENILEFPDSFPGARVLLLEQNYRSVMPVLDLANGVLDSARQGYGKRLFSELTEGPMPVAIAPWDEWEQADLVLEQILQRQREGVPLSQQAVLVRGSHQATPLELRLNERGIPFRKFGGQRFTEAAHVKDVFCLVRIVHNPRDVTAWLRVLTWFDGLGQKGAQGIAARIEQSLVPKLEPEVYKRRKYHAALVELAKVLEQASDLKEDVGELVEVLIDWYEERMPSLYEDYKRRLRDLEVIPSLAERYENLSAFVSEVVLDPVGEEEAHGHDEDALVVSTIHSAKGLEWDVVYLMSLINGAFPSGYALDDPEQMEEERRLLYVAVTRARRDLLLSAPQRLSSSRGQYFVPGNELLESIEDLHTLVAVADGGDAGWSSGKVQEAEEDEELIQYIMDFFDD